MKMDKVRCGVVLPVAVGLLIGLPIWWKTTEVHRAPLPQFILNQGAESSFVQAPVALNVVLLSSTVSDFESGDAVPPFQALRSLNQGFNLWGVASTPGVPFDRSSNTFHRETVQNESVSLFIANRTSCSQYSQSLGKGAPCQMRWQVPPAVWASLTSHQQDEQLLSLAQGPLGSNAYTVFLVSRESSARPGPFPGRVPDSIAIEEEVDSYRTFPSQNQREEGPIAVIGKHRHAWISLTSRVSTASFEEILVSKVVQVARQMVQGASQPVAKLAPKSKHPLVSDSKPIARPQSERNSGAKAPRMGRAKKTGGPMPLAADGSALLSFSLLNAEPADWNFDWDFAAADELYLAPLVRAIRPVAELTVESQVLHYAKAQVRPTWEAEHQAFTVSSSALPFFVNSNEWHLDASVAAAGRSKILHLVVYVPAAHECPLHFKLPSGKLSPTDGFTVPSWGGVVVWNPPNCSRPDFVGDITPVIPPEEMRRILSVQIGQIRSLLGLPAAPKQSPELHTLSPGRNGFADWEVAALVRKRAVEDSQEALSTLQSLSTLVSELSNMVVQDSITDQMRSSLAEAGRAQSAMLNGSYEAAASAARRARAHAESAFFHPTLVSLLYFPSEHHMAIYMPLFLPVLVNVCTAVFRETLTWGRARSKQRLSEALGRVRRTAS